MSSPVDESALINPAAFPFRSADLDTSLITGSAGDVVGLGEGVAGAAGDAQSAWRGLQAPGVFESPDGEAVYGLMGPAVSGAAVMSGVTTRVGAALETYAAALDGIKPTLAEFEERAVAFRTEALAGYQVSNWEARGWLGNFETGVDGNPVPRSDANDLVHVPWNEHGPAVEKNASLLGELNRIIESVSTAAATCANTIQAELTTVCAVPAQAITAAALDANPDVSSWGRPVEESRNCTESVGHGLGNFWEGTWTGAASLIGRDPESGDWSWGVAGRSWLGVGDFALSTVIVTSPLLSSLAYTEGPVGGFVAGRMDVAVTAWGSLIGWDHQAFLAGQDGWKKWRADGVAAGTEVVANIGTFFIPGAGAAAGSAKGVVTGTRIGGFVARTAVRVGEIVVPGGSHLVAGAVRVVDLGAGGVKSGWRALADVVKPVTRPNALPGVVDTATRNVSLPAHTPVSDAIRLDQPNTRTHGAGVPDEAQGGNESPSAPRGTAPTSSRAGSYDPSAPVRETVRAVEAPTRYKPVDVQRALDDAPQNEWGQPVDHRNGRPLLLENINGDRGWVMRWDEANHSWVAENRGLSEYGMEAKGVPGSYGYDANGDLLPYANYRPAYAPEQVEGVWEASRAEQIADIKKGKLRLDTPGENQMWVRVRDNVNGPDLVDLGPDKGKWRLIEWEPGQSRKGIWDMGHLDNAKYSDLRDRYLSGRISTEQFLERYRNPKNYRVEDPGRNQAHDDEVATGK